MFDQVKEAAGIHMATFKSAKGEERVDEEDDPDISGWTPPPHMLAQWTKAV